MLRRSQRIRTSPITKAQVAQKNTTVARRTIGLDKSLTRASHTSAGTGCQRKTKTGPCCPGKLRKACGNGGRPSQQTATPPPPPPAHSPPPPSNQGYAPPHPPSPTTTPQ